MTPPLRKGGLLQRAVVLMVSTGVFAAPSITRAEPTRVILFIGDGFGAAQTSFGLAYARMIDGRELAIERLMQDGNTGYALPIASSRSSGSCKTEIRAMRFRLPTKAR